MSTPTITPKIRALIYSVQRVPDYLNLVDDTISTILERTVIDDDLTDEESMRIVRTLYSIRADYRALATIDIREDPHDQDQDDDGDETSIAQAITRESLKLLKLVQGTPEYVELINDVISEIIERIVIDDDLTDCRAMSLIRTLYSIRGDYRDLSAIDGPGSPIDEAEDPEPNEEGGAQ